MSATSDVCDRGRVSLKGGTTQFRGWVLAIFTGLEDIDEVEMEKKQM